MADKMEMDRQRYATLMKLEHGMSSFDAVKGADFETAFNLFARDGTEIRVTDQDRAWMRQYEEAQGERNDG